MKRKITSKFSGTSAKGREYFGLEFIATIIDGKMHDQITRFVDRESYDAHNIGDFIEF
jgi:hypothetical protein